MYETNLAKKRQRAKMATPGILVKACQMLSACSSCWMLSCDFHVPDVGLTATVPFTVGGPSKCCLSSSVCLVGGPGTDPLRWCCGSSQFTSCGSTTRKRRIMMPIPAMIDPADTNAQPHVCVPSQIPGMTDPRMLPTDVWAFHMPMTRPRLPLPNQLPITATTLGQPRRLCYATEELHEDEVGEAVDVRPERHAEGHGEQSAQCHSGEQQVAQTDAIAEMSHEEHGDGISEQESEVHIAQSRVIVKRQPPAVGFARVRVLSEGWRADAVEASPIKFVIIAVVVCLLVPCAVVRVPGRLHNTDGLSRQMVSGIAAER